MKYEITKGSEEDFEQAPEWAEVKTRTDFGEFWLQKHSLGGLSQLIGHDNTVEITSFPYKEEIIAERRPITEPVVNQQLTTAWSGKGLPPVGFECEIKRVLDWFPVTIKFISDYYTVILTRGGTEDVYQTSALQFRPMPIRSPEDVSRDEAVNAMLNIFGKNAATGTTAAIKALYDAGYRKME